MNSVWDEKEVRQFLEQNLGLSQSRKIPGRIVSDHNEALFFWEELINNKKLSDPFDVVHVDSHADLGLGGAAWSFLQKSFLTLPVDSRRKIREYKFCDRVEKINMGDYLLVENRLAPLRRTLRFSTGNEIGLLLSVGQTKPLLYSSFMGIPPAFLYSILNFPVFHS